MRTTTVMTMMITHLSVVDSQANYPSRKEGFGSIFTLKSDKKRDAFLDWMLVSLEEGEEEPEE